MADLSVRYSEGMDRPYRAGADLDGATFVKVSAVGTEDETPVIVACAAGDATRGLTAYSVKTGQLVNVHKHPGSQVRVKSSAAIAVGAPVQVSGAKTVATTSTGATVGFADQAATASGQDIYITLV